MGEQQTASVESYSLSHGSLGIPIGFRISVELLPKERRVICMSADYFGFMSR